ncbi:juvenile hormone acid O-methyltransferase-like isoform X2 [Branchiostoma floridae x Branchiostoma japonicum]
MDTGKPEQYSQNRSYQHSEGVEALQKYVTWEGGDTVLDAGCGTGELCSYISQQPGVASVVGFDLSPDFISYARTNNSSPNVRYHVADAADPSTIKPEWRGAFSKVVSFFALHWVKDKPTALKALNSCLKPGGEIVFVCVSDKSKFHEVPLELSSLPKWSIYLKDAAPALFPWPSCDITAEHRSSLLEACGFEVIACDIKKHQYSWKSKDQFKISLRSVLPHLSYIPEDKQEEFMDDLIKLAEERHWITGDEVPTIHESYLVVRARKL